MSAKSDIGERIAALCARRRFGMRPGLERTEALMEALGHPERTFAAIHVAGTNGKGSVAAIAASVLQNAGVGDVGLYTSPHLVFFNERIRIRKSTVISTNLSLSGLKERYTERIASRILSEYELIHTDCADIRLRKKFEK